MGFLSRLLVPRKVRRVAHPGRAVKRAVTPKAVRQVSHALHPIDNAVYGAQRSVATSLRGNRKPARQSKRTYHAELNGQSCGHSHLSQREANLCAQYWLLQTLESSEKEVEQLLRDNPAFESECVDAIRKLHVQRDRALSKIEVLRGAKQ